MIGTDGRRILDLIRAQGGSARESHLRVHSGLLSGVFERHRDILASYGLTRPEGDKITLTRHGRDTLTGG